MNDTKINEHTFLKELAEASNVDMKIMDHLKVLIGHALEQDINDDENTDTRKRKQALLVGYQGAGNTGAEVRVYELVQRLVKLDFDCTVITQGWLEGLPAVEQVKQVVLSVYFPVQLYELIPKFDVVIACEGSMFKSTFSSTLTLYQAGTLALGKAFNKSVIGYGAEIGMMEPWLEDFVKEYCAEVPILFRSEGSYELGKSLGLNAFNGTDSAWTYIANSGKNVIDVLKSNGWDGHRKVLALCPIDPYCWPVRPDFKRYLKMIMSKTTHEDHFKGILFYNEAPLSNPGIETFLDGFTKCLDHPSIKEEYFPILVGMDEADYGALKAVQNRVGSNIPIFCNTKDYTPPDIVSLLAASDLVITARYHASVFALANGVPCIGLAIDERINNLFEEIGTQAYAIDAFAPDLSTQVAASLQSIQANESKIKSQINTLVQKQEQSLTQMDEMLLSALDNKLTPSNKQ